MLQFADAESEQCRMQQIQQYFGEEIHQTCGSCDVCKRNSNPKEAFRHLKTQILALVQHNKYTSAELAENLQANTNQIRQALQELVEEEQIMYDNFSWSFRK